MQFDNVGCPQRFEHLSGFKYGENVVTLVVFKLLLESKINI